MITVQKDLTLPDTYPLKRLGRREKLLFFDIETTGLSGDRSQLYLIGCTFFRAGGWRLIQWFADTPGDEPAVLTAFFEFLKQFTAIVHFNGDGFDIPFLLKRCRAWGLAYDFSAVRSIDIYRRIRPYRLHLGLDNLKQKSIECFLGVFREDRYSGGELIEVYRDYLLTRDNRLYDMLMLHNREDLEGMPLILPVLNYPDLFEHEFMLQSQTLLRRPEMYGGAQTRPESFGGGQPQSEEPSGGAQTQPKSSGSAQSQSESSENAQTQPEPSGGGQPQPEPSGGAQTRPETPGGGQSQSEELSGDAQSQSKPSGGGQPQPESTEAAPTRPVLRLDVVSAYAVPVAVAWTVSSGSHPCRIRVSGNRLTAELELLEGTLKHFYPDYQNYYYLPFEDTAIHKSVGEYVERSARKKATPQTCYTRKYGVFLPQAGGITGAEFREEYRDKLSYVEYQESLFQNNDNLNRYLHGILSLSG